MFHEDFFNMPKKIKKLQPEVFDLECSTVWSFPRRGNWATHDSKYRGNWSPDVVRNLLLRYSKEGDWVMDPMIGGGTTAVECKLLHRHLIAFDVNPAAIERTRDAVNFEYETLAELVLELDDARKAMKKVKDESIDFILHHPPYADIIQYSEGKIPEDLSNIHDIDAFADEMEKIAKECYRSLKK